MSAHRFYSLPKPRKVLHCPLVRRLPDLNGFVIRLAVGFHFFACGVDRCAPTRHCIPKVVKSDKNLRIAHVQQIYVVQYLVGTIRGAIPEAGMPKGVSVELEFGRHFVHHLLDAIPQINEGSEPPPPRPAIKKCLADVYPQRDGQCQQRPGRLDPRRPFGCRHA